MSQPWNPVLKHGWFVILGCSRVPTFLEEPKNDENDSSGNYCGLQLLELLFTHPLGHLVGLEGVRSVGNILQVCTASSFGHQNPNINARCLISIAL